MQHALEVSSLPEPLERIPELWFDDDNLVLRAENSIYRISKGLLAARSSVFADMLSFPEGEEHIDGCPVVQLHDTSSFFQPPPSKTDLATITGILRLSHKYDVQYLRRRALQHLDTGYPTSLDVFEVSGSETFRSDGLDDSLVVIRCASEVGATWVLPSAFYFLCYSDMRDILKSPQWPLLTAVDQETTIVSYTKQRLACPPVLPFLRIPFTEGCSTLDECSEYRTLYLEDVGAWNISDPLGSYRDWTPFETKVSHDASRQNRVDMDAARAATTVDVLALRDFLHGGSAKWTARARIVDILQQDPIFDKTQRPFLTRKELYTRGQALTNRLYELKEAHHWSDEEATIAVSVLDDALPIALHNIAFEPVFRLQASDALLAHYAHLVATKGILGCYLQTELGHGTNVRMLETTATYQLDTQEFEIHSPTLTSTKWWIGSLGKTATHGVVQAKLILPGGKDMGPHLFFVQLRSLADHRPLPGRTLGDIGPKALAGYASTDNGFARFDRVRIPKEYMLSKFADVTAAGEYVTPPHAKLSYGGMLYIRSGCVVRLGHDVAGLVAGLILNQNGATVAIRYATVRRQGAVGSDGLEHQVISYPSLHIRLVPLVARAYAFIELGRALSRGFDSLAKGLSSGDTSQLAEMHVMTSGLKVLASTTTIQDLEIARRSMGGHGYSAFAGVGRMYADYLPAATYEGENFVLDGQVLRAALKAFKNLSSSKELAPSSFYLRLVLDTQHVPPRLGPESWSDPAISILLLEWRAARLVNEAALVAASPDPTTTQRVSKAVTEAFVAARIGEMIATLASESTVVRKVYNLYLLTTVESALTDLLSLGLFNVVETATKSLDPTRELRLSIAQSCADLLPEAIGLTDAFGFTDWELDSSLGRYDGNVYEAIWNRVRDEPLNQTEVTEAYHVCSPSLCFQRALTGVLEIDQAFAVARVWIATNIRDHRVAACKVIRITDRTLSEDRKKVDKEMRIHAQLKHTNVLELLDAVIVEMKYAQRYHPGYYLLLELAAGGDLFDKIAPDVGLDDDLSHLYFNQLLSGMDYVHKEGVCHRDLKPENILLDAAGTLKICDFGLSTVYKLKDTGRVRMLSERSGSLPYVAPELNGSEPYAAEPIDVWGMGVILFTFLAGNTPWDEPSRNSPEFMAYLSGEILQEQPWCRFSSQALSLIQGLLTVDPRDRFTLADAFQHPWCQRPSQLAKAGMMGLADALCEPLRQSGDMDLAEPDLGIRYSTFSPTLFFSTLKFQAWKMKTFQCSRQ
ncbi:unnamed protein product [Mycena citricolor]|uniref:Protein kinase domain-containing protein n=1 Tax=Mycena citricolor TaxID=2018698 RepID=A0AAD2GU11_9AGAR|nr:unnamed protein product [Mycena citricolor]